ATIEPWHGDQVVLYEPSENDWEKPWKRTVLDKELKWGHALAWADLNGDGKQELVVGVRDTLHTQYPQGVRLYQHQPDSTWKRQLLDPGGVAGEDLAVADLDGDGRHDIVAVGRATRNVRIYWNRTK
ncbi:MAG TPA: VCBS repeat-containing protein, partial [Gemmatales bacterium]|nr:VCBS repeat-containing protein [Gemmatales bacterium]